MKKRVLPLLLTLALCLSLFVLPAAAAPEEFVIEDGILYYYNGPGGKVVIPEGVTQIYDDAFQEEDVTQVVFPKSLRLIGSSAFDHCSELQEITIPGGVEQIEYNAFQNCTGLTSVTLGEGLQALGESAFCGCVSLTQVDLPESLCSIQDSTFQDCIGLTSITIPEGVTEIGSRAFYSCTRLKEVQLPSTLEKCNIIEAFRRTPWLRAQGDFVISHDTLFLYQGKQDAVAVPDGVKRIGACAFMDSSLRSVSIPGSVKKIEDSAFADCTELKRVIMHEGLEELSGFNFFQCYSLTDVTIPKSVTKFGGHIFKYTPWQENQEFTVANGVLLGYEGEGGAVAIPDGVKEISPYAFAENETIEEVAIPASVETVGYNAFNRCYSLERVNYTPSLTEIGADAFVATPWLEEQGNFPEINGILLACQGTDRDIVISEGIRQFAGQALYGRYYDRVNSITIPGTVKELNTGAIYSEYACKPCLVILEEGVERIGPEALDWDGLSLAVLPASLTEIAPDAFQTENVTFYVPEGSYAEAYVKAQDGTFIQYGTGGSLTGFTDVGNDAYFSKAVLWALAEGITEGTSETTFSPERACTREEIITFLWRAAGSLDMEETLLSYGDEGETLESLRAQFQEYCSDVSPEDSSYPAILWGLFEAIPEYELSETGDTLSFHPKAPCTRASAMAFLSRYQNGYAYEEEESGFDDIPAGAPYANAVIWGMENGITQGTSETTFSPDRPCTRGEIVTFLYRAMAWEW